MRRIAGLQPAGVLALYPGLWAVGFSAPWAYLFVTGPSCVAEGSTPGLDPTRVVSLQLLDKGNLHRDVANDD